MRNLLLALILAVPSYAASSSIDRDKGKGLGIDREHITDAQIRNRTANVKKEREFWLLRNPDAKDAWKLGHDKKLLELIRSAAAPWPDVKPDVLVGLLRVESSFRPNVSSPKGPAGIGQLTKAVVKDYNKTVERSKRLDLRRFVGYNIEKKLVWKGRGKKRRQVIVEKKTKVYEDDRMDPEKALPVTAWFFHTLLRTFGREDLAIQAYHDGAGRMFKTLSLYTGTKVTEKNAASIVDKFNLNWPRIFFNNTPTYKPALYKRLLDLRQNVDDAPLYYFTVLEAMDLHSLPEAEYDARRRGYIERYGQETGLTNPIPSFYTKQQWDELTFKDIAALVEAKKDEKLVSLPWEQFGIKPRLKGDGIGSMDPANQMHYVQGSPESVGTLVFIANELRTYEHRKDDPEHPRPFEPIETTSMIRSREYQDWLEQGRKVPGFGFKKPNVNARTPWPTHIIAKASDLAFAKVSKQRRISLPFILNDLKDEGMIAFYWEGKAQSTLHVVPYPQWEAFFSFVYRQAAALVPLLQPAIKKARGN